MTRRALITGVGGGIGGATARLLASSGWQVLGLDIVDQQVTDHLAHFERCDVAEADTVSEVVGRLSGGGLDLLVNNAAVQPSAGSADEVPEVWDNAFAVNVRAAYLAIQAAAEALRATNGAVVNIASVHALATSGGRAAYVATKGALVALTRSVALELAPHARANAVLPGAVATCMLDDGIRAAGLGRADLAARVPLGRVAEATEIAEAVAFLGDGTRSGYITGQSLVVDGGVLARISSE